MADIDLRHLQYFVATAERGSFVKAARLVNVSQPAITKSIQRMEKWFGHPVFERGAELRLTEFGSALLEDAKRVLGGFDDLLAAANLFGEARALTLRVGAGPLMAETMVGQAVGRVLGASGEGARIRIVVDDYTVFSGMLRERKIDLFIADISELRSDADMKIEKLKPSRMRWFCRKGHPLARRKIVSMAEVLAFPVVLPEMPSWAKEWFASHLSPGLPSGGVAPPFLPAVVCSHFSTLRQIVLASDAVSATMELALNQSPYLNDMTGIAFKGDTPSSNPGIVTLKKRRLPPIAQSLIAEVVRISEAG